MIKEDINDTNRELKKFLDITDERLEELMDLSKKIFENNISRVNNETHTLDVAKLIIEYENRTDLSLREKLSCVFQSGMNAQRLLEIDKKYEIEEAVSDYIR